MLFFFSFLSPSLPLREKHGAFYPSATPPAGRRASALTPSHCVQENGQMLSLTLCFLRPVTLLLFWKGEGQ
jgi:hypothetical protein